MPEGSFKRELVLSIIFIIIGFLSLLSVVGFFVWGIPIGLLFFSFSIWHFAMYRYKKKIPINNTLILFLVPLMGLYAVFMQHLSWGQTGLEVFVFWIVAIWSVYRFFRKAKSI